MKQLVARLRLSVSADPHHSRENICSKSADGSPQTVQAKLDPPLGAIPVPLEDGEKVTEKRTSDHTPAEAENRNPAFHIKLKIKAGDLFKGCSFVWVTVLHKAQAKISPSFFCFCKPANMEVVAKSQTWGTPWLPAVKALSVSAFM